MVLDVSFAYDRNSVAYLWMQTTLSILQLVQGDPVSHFDLRMRHRSQAEETRA